MAIDRFQNKNILTATKVPVEHTQVYSKSDTAKMRKGSTIIPAADLTFTTLEKHVYSGDTLIKSLEGSLDWEVSENTETKSNYDILLNPEQDVRLAGVTKGYYSILYNFLDNLSTYTDINRISADSTELELTLRGDYSFSDLYDVVRAQSNLNTDFVLNFGDNEIVPIVGIDFNNNPRVGESVSNVSYPSGEFEGKATRWWPVSNDKNNFWLEAFTSKPLANNMWSSITSTGRASKWKLAIGADGNPMYVQQKDSNGAAVFYTEDGDIDRRYPAPPKGYKYPKINNPYQASVRYYNPTLKDVSNLKTVVVKLYKPLKDNLQPLRPKVQRLVRDSYIERTLVYPYKKEETYNNFSAPNFKIDLGNYGKSQGTDLKTWNSLLDANLSTSQQIVDTYLSGSKDGTDLNIDYSDIANFVNYSSAVERVNNFRYKLELIESFDDRIRTLNSTRGSEALTNISQSVQRKSNVISGFDGFEKWMYYESTGSLYTHYSSSAYTIEPWPKYSEYPNKNYSVTASQAISHYNGLIDSSSIYDAFNDSRLTKMIPAAIVEDPQNVDYVLFIDMIGHHYDITWSYIKALTSLNDREEHPYDGMPDNMLYNVASSMGWKLTHTQDRSDLWNFAVGTDKFGNYIQSGSLPSKSGEQYNSEVWRRITNNIPYLLKTKGSARAVKALISTYGIPQSFLSIREYGGPMVKDVRPIWEHDRFVYHLRLGVDNYITSPWGHIADIDPNTYLNRDPNPIDTVELQFQQNYIRTSSLLNKDDDFAVVLVPTDKKKGRGNIHFYLNGDSGYKSASINDVPLFDKKMSTLLIQREVSVDDITKTNQYKIQYRRNRKEQVVISKSASIFIDGASESSYNAAWTGSGVLNIGKGNLPSVGTPSEWADAEFMSGSIQELRYWANPLKDIVIDEHTLSRETYHGNSATSSYFDLKFRFIPDSQIKNVNESYDGIFSQHPNQRINTLSDGRILSASLFNFKSDDLRGVTEEYWTKVPSAGANNILSNKVRLEDNKLTGILDPEHKKEISQYDKAPVDSNQVGVYLSATKMYNEDIYNHTGYFEIDDYIGNPDRRAGFTEQNEELDYVRRQVFKKYSSRNLINTTIDILSRYDFTVFEQIRQTMPARVDYNSGILIEPHILERPKEKSKAGLRYTNPQYDTVIPTPRPISSEFIQYETTIERPMSESADYIMHDAIITNQNQQTTADYLVYDTKLKLNRTVVLDSTYLLHTASISGFDYTKLISAQRDDLHNLGNTQIRDMISPSSYKYNILTYSDTAEDIGFGAHWTTGSNGYWNYTPLGKTIDTARASKYGQTRVWFYSTAQDAATNTSTSSSLIPARVSTDELPLSIANLRFNGCKMTSDSLTTNSPDTPDGRPVIEIFEADPNVLIYTSQTADAGNLDVDTSTNIPTLNIDELSVSSTLEWDMKQKYDAAVKKFRKKLESLMNIEDSRITEFDIKIEAEMLRYELELLRREEFDIINGDI